MFRPTSSANLVSLLPPLLLLLLLPTTNNQTNQPIIRLFKLKDL
jgi:hypothetical protein